MKRMKFSEIFKYKRITQSRLEYKVTKKKLSTSGFCHSSGQYIENERWKNTLIIPESAFVWFGFIAYQPF